MISDVTLYKGCKIEMGKNFIVDDIETYLSSIGPVNTVVIEDFQMQKIQLNLSIKINIYQSYLEYNSVNNYNYVKIVNKESSESPSGKAYYFFVTKREWLSQNTVKLYLYMDTINTFKPTTDFTFNGKTHINRQHKDRFTKGSYTTSFELSGETAYDPNEPYYYYEQVFEFEYGALTHAEISNTSANIQISYINYSTNGYTIKIWTREGEDTHFTVTVTLDYNGYRRVIDPYSEGLSPILYKNYENDIDNTGVSWNLIYKNNDAISPSAFNQVNPVNVFLAPDEDLPIKVRVGGSITYGTDLLNGVDYCVGIENNGGLNPNFRSFRAKIGDLYYDLSLKVVGVSALYGTIYEALYLKLTRDNTNINCEIYSMRYRKPYTVLIPYGSPSLRTTKVVSEVSWSTPKDKVYYSNDFNDRDLQSGYFSMATWSNKTLNGINSLDRTDSTLVKIIKLPYCPVELSIDNGVYTFTNDWEYDGTSGFMKLLDFTVGLESSLEITANNPFRVLQGYWKEPTIDDYRIALNDSKLYHSDYYLPKFVYDSFVYPIALEDVDSSSISDGSNFDLKFVVSNSVNSRFLFDFDIPFARATEDYPTILNVARNNEVTIFSNQFINYLRTGYNYDVKSKERQDTSSIIGAGLGIVGSIASVGLGIASMNPAVAVSGVIGAVSTITNTLISSVNSIAQREANLESKMAQYKSQSTSVMNADDIDLLVYYSRNRLKQTTYKASNLLLNILDDLFHYSGYATDEMGTPDMTSRCWFNFVACDLVANTVSYISSEIESDLVSKYAEGVTFLHNNYSVWNFDLDKENWEVSIL